MKHGPTAYWPGRPHVKIWPDRQILTLGLIGHFATPFDTGPLCLSCAKVGLIATLFDTGPLCLSCAKIGHIATSFHTGPLCLSCAKIGHIATLFDTGPLCLSCAKVGHIALTLELAASVPSTLPMWPVSVAELISFVRDEHRVRLWSPARYALVSVLWVSTCGHGPDHLSCEHIDQYRHLFLTLGQYCLSCANFGQYRHHPFDLGQYRLSCAQL